MVGNVRRLGIFVASFFSCSSITSRPAYAFQPISIYSSRVTIKQYTPSLTPYSSRYSHVSRQNLKRNRDGQRMSSSDAYAIASSPNKRTRTTAVYALILINLAVFLADKVFRAPFVMHYLYLFHRRWSWWQPLTTCFCHSDRNHLSSNLFLLLLFGRSVEDDLGSGGLILSYVFCGVLASLASLILMPRHTVSIGASGAVFGLFAVSTLTKLSWREIFDWRKLVELAVLGEFVFRQLTSELSTAARGGRYGINHTAHLSGALAGVLLVFGMRMIVASSERSEKLNRNKQNYG